MLLHARCCYMLDNTWVTTLTNSHTPQLDLLQPWKVDTVVIPPPFFNKRMVSSLWRKVTTGVIFELGFGFPSCQVVVSQATDSHSSRLSFPHLQIETNSCHLLQFCAWLTDGQKLSMPEIVQCKGKPPCVKQVLRPVWSPALNKPIKWAKLIGKGRKGGGIY